MSRWIDRRRVGRCCIAITRSISNSQFVPLLTFYFRQLRIRTFHGLMLVEPSILNVFTHISVPINRKRIAWNSVALELILEFQICAVVNSSSDPEIMWEQLVSHSKIKLVQGDVCAFASPQAAVKCCRPNRNGDEKFQNCHQKVEPRHRDRLSWFRDIIVATDDPFLLHGRNPSQNVELYVIHCSDMSINRAHAHIAIEIIQDESAHSISPFLNMLKT
mmetsp:Transcript_24908/g.61271  ORF Transcript_24908/g.61271 Transcript_24908/m.61271 type:complete len:218 (+) Transcript_24908:363-1016(+)